MSSPGRLIGTAAVHGERYKIGAPETGYGFWEEIAPGAFDRALAERDDVRLLVDHIPSKLLGRTSSGSLQLSADGGGLHVVADLPDTGLGRDTAALLERRDLSQMSFAWSPRGTKEEWSKTAAGHELVRVLSVGQLYDVSVVTYPAYTTTTAGLSRADATGHPYRSLVDERARARARHFEARFRLEELERAIRS